MESAKTEHQRLMDAKPLEEDAPKTKATNLSKQLEASEQRRTEVAKLEERVELMRNDALLSDLPELKANLHAREANMRMLETDFLAYRFIMDAANDAREEAQAQSRSQITDQLDSSSARLGTRTSNDHERRQYASHHRWLGFRR